MAFPRGVERIIFFAAYGEAVYHSSALEEAFVQLFALAEIQHPDERYSETIQGLLDTRRKQTLGKLIRQAKEQIDLPEHITNELEPALKTRNWLAHHFHRDTLIIMADDEKREAVTKRLREIQGNFIQLYSFFAEEILRRMEAIGVSREEIEQSAAEIRARYSETE